MTDLNKPSISTLMEELDDMRRRIRRLEGGNPLVGELPPGSSIKIVDPADGSTLMILGEMTSSAGLGAQFHDAAGDVVVQIGQLNSFNGMRAGINPDGSSTTTSLQISPHGLDIPYIPVACTNPALYTSVTSGTFETIFRATVPMLTSFGVQMYAPLAVDAATTGEARIYVSSSVISDVATLPAASSAYYTWDWDLTATGLLLGSGPVTFDLQVRRNSGAANVNVYTPSFFVGWNTLAVVGGL